MKYLCLIYNSEEALASIPDSDVEAVVAACRSHCDSLRASGHLLASARLDTVDAAATLRFHNGGSVVTDGPFAETKEQLGGFYLIDARDFNEALRIAACIPPARLGGIEVRPIRDCDLP